MSLSTVMMGIILIVIGVLIFVYQGFSYKKNQKIAQVGDLKVSAGFRRFVYLPPVAGGICLVVGIILVILGKL
jgi:uncharacterized membrane protein